MTYACCDENRRAAVDAHPTLNGIDWLEVLDADAPEGPLRQRVLVVRLLKPAPAALTRDNVRIVGGERVRGVGVVWAAPAVAPPPDQTSPAERDYYATLPGADRVLLARTDRAGDFSSYRLKLVKGPGDDGPPPGFDPRLVEVAFSFKVECPSHFDCKPARVRGEGAGTPPDVDYLAKDYAGFRRLMLDRLSRLLPGWRERSAADLGVALTEVLAYTADHLSYWQDAVGTEAYLETARRRTSLRRHALLVDYAVHEGCNARAWVQVRVAADRVPLAKGSARFYTRVSGAPERIAPGSRDEQQALRQAPLVFEPLHDAVLCRSHHEICFYTWGDGRCRLPRGATAATLCDDPASRVRLRPGDVLVFVERVGPHSGLEGDANPLRRHAVRLTRVAPEAAPVRDGDGAETDRVPGPLTLDPLTAGTGSERAVVQVEWARADALPFPLCLSSQTDEAHGSRPVADVSVALGNIVLADHGRTVAGEALGPVPEPRLFYPPPGDASPCEAAGRVPVPPRFRPRLAQGPLTRVGQAGKGAAPFDPDAPAGAAMTWELARVVPEIRLDPERGGIGEVWTPRRDLLLSGPTDPHFVVETEHDGTSRLRFGDGVHGRRPPPGSRFRATYRAGNGPGGNVGAEAIAHVVTPDARVLSVVNPLAARGGAEPESAEQVRRRAPQAFRTQERAVTPGDYAAATGRLAGVQRAAASLRWTGSWHTVFVTVDREEGRRLEEDDRRSLLRHLERYRMAGHDLRVDDPVYVSLELDLRVCVKPDHFRSDVRQALGRVLGSGVLADGRRGAFHPDRFSFGQTVYASPLYAAAREVPGVASVQITRFQRLGQEDPKPLADGFLPLGRLEIARLDNDPNFPEHGVLRLELRGGK